MNDVMRTPSLLRRVPGLSQLPPPMLEALAFAFVERSHAPGTVLRGPGAQSTAHLLLAGEVAVARDGACAERLGPGALFGLSPSTSGASYRAAGPVKTAALGPQGISMLTRLRHHHAQDTTMQTTTRLTYAAALGGIASTALASLACVGPLLAALLGIGGMGVLSQTASLRLPATLLTFALLGLGFALAYRPARTCASRRKLSRVRSLLWVATTIALTMALFTHFTLPRLG